MKNLIEIIDQLASTASTLEKQAILKEHQDNENLKKIFLWTYNPMVNYYIKKIPEISPTTIKQLSLDSKNGMLELEHLLNTLNDRIVTGHAAIKEVKDILSLFDEESRKLAEKIILRDLRCNVTDTTANKIWKDLIPTFEVQLANTFDPEKPTAKVYYASPKMDGLRGMFVSRSGLFTRQGKKIMGFDALETELQEVCDTCKVGGIDGELFSTEIPFEEIQGSVMRNKNIKQEEKDKIRFYVFAVIKNFKNREVFEKTEDMVNKIHEIFKTKRRWMIQVPQVLVKVEDIDRIHDEFVEQKYEGMMLRSLDKSYEFKRSKSLLKFKKFFESDLKVTGMFEGKGKYQNLLGGFSVEGEIEGVKVMTEVGSGFNDEQRAEYWKAKNSLIGCKVEIKYQGVTPDGSLRFPVFNKFKLDR